MKTLANKMTTTTTLIKCILMVLVFAFSTKGFSQNAVTVSTDSLINKNVEVVKSGAVALDSELDFVSWFMGTKQISTEKNATDNGVIEASKSTKRQLLSSGITVNRILYKVLLKKMVNQEISIA